MSGARAEIAADRKSSEQAIMPAQNPLKDRD